ncbi:hypothetical protein H112_03097 [Trichophyton rubrum D6]|uniref:Uncharacterized protein n=3 Tax=Trichophyton TaxID=5550 RepID=F2STB3_TRIRC|nr:uncharacterized protein TERG_05714 [Trichophyton rubrum CBS 118892]EZF24219.1 hypothetical protein H100_03103 [Trichophyton rubrum MR850]EZF43382.1 hypothetical protein H102_03096 [Trichophyton rubrum CBS 100081]EZF54024.1 hypothetical protein H103_03110 [Trichophyton rubrum CBS 288.86]EZF64694.1 hypothetical protein H104_03091 [Trichophyton rubrum CBS 289.86]EZF75298.1 hypothetical protein H105_03115 [Trichophyton soudanense CBS 452.61]EZF85930.1 hypothetical protein H110_03104 [Trichophy
MLSFPLLLSLSPFRIFLALFHIFFLLSPLQWFVSSCSGAYPGSYSTRVGRDIRRPDHEYHGEQTRGYSVALYSSWFFSWARSMYVCMNASQYIVSGQAKGTGCPSALCLIG